MSLPFCFVFSFFFLFFFFHNHSTVTEKKTLSALYDDGRVTSYPVPDIGKIYIMYLVALQTWVRD